MLGLEISEHRGERCAPTSPEGASDRAEEWTDELCEELGHVPGDPENVLGVEVEGRIEVVAQGSEPGFPRWPRRAMTLARESAMNGKGFAGTKGAADG